MSIQKLLGLVLTAVVCVNAAQAEENACLLEGSITLMGQTTEIKDCMQGNKGTDPDDVKKMCESLAKMGAGFGSPPKVTYMAECPKPAQASCQTTMIHSFYYKRNAEDLVATKESCDYQKGKWSE